MIPGKKQDGLPFQKLHDGNNKTKQEENHLFRNLLDVETYYMLNGDFQSYLLNDNHSSYANRFMCAAEWVYSYRCSADEE